MPAKKIKIHFIGIGGIGVSALARYYLKKGHEVSGSDLVSSEITKALRKRGAKITIGKKIAKKDANLTIYSLATPRPSQSPNFISYPEALGRLTRQYYTIAVCGTHGKSTTTAMLGLILTKAGLDPTVILGTKLKEFGDSNCRVGKSRYLVIEADEHFAAFLNYWPKIIVLTNIEKDHLDYYKTFANLRKTFKKFIARLPKDGVLITRKSAQKKDMQELRKALKVPGEHNVYNAALALEAARALKVPDRVSFKALSEYKGSWRRFEEKRAAINHKSVVIVSDYGHHPTEVKVTLKAAREKYPKKKIWCVFQPHQYQRTYYLFHDFVKVFKSVPVDKLIITDVYDVAGREKRQIKQKVNSKKLVAAINVSKIVFLPRGKIFDYLKKNLQGGEVLIIMGAGDIYDLFIDILKRN